MISILLEKNEKKHEIFQEICVVYVVKKAYDTLVKLDDLISQYSVYVCDFLTIF